MDPHFNNLTDVQQKLHGLETTSGKYRIDFNNRPTFLMGPEREKFAYYSIDNEVLSGTESSKNNWKFYIDMNQHWLQAIEYREKWPEVSVKPEFQDDIQIGWTHNPGTNCFTSASIVFSTSKRRFTLDSNGIDMVNSVLRTKNRQSFQKSIGNTEEMEGWNTVLYENTTNPVIHWWITKSTASALPIFYFANMNPIDNIYLEFTTRREVSSLLRMRKRISENEWMIIKPDFSYLNGVEPNSVIPPPEVHAYYVNSIQDEIDELLNKPSCNKDKSFSEIYKIEDIISINIPNTFNYNMTASEKSSTEHPAKLLVVMAENLISKEYNLHSNYTTNPYNLYKGSYPISQVILKNEKENREKFYDLDTMQNMMSLFLKKTPIENGYFTIIRSMTPNDIADSNGISLSTNDIKISAVLTDTSLNKNEPPNQKFSVKIRILVSRFINFYYNRSTQKFDWSIDSHVV